MDGKKKQDNLEEETREQSGTKGGEVSSESREEQTEDTSKQQPLPSDEQGSTGMSGEDFPTEAGPMSDTDE